MNQQSVQHLGFILHESINGHHVLFDNEMIRNSFAQDAHSYQRVPKEILGATHAVFDILTDLPTLSEKQNFISSLPDEIRNLLIYFYFEFLDRFVQEMRPTFH